MSDKRQITDPSVLKALAHPMRLKLYQLLQKAPSTVGALAKQVGGDPGQVSYHLRELAKQGFITDAPEEVRDLRQHWWKAVPGTMSWSRSDFTAPEDLEVVDTLRGQWLVEQFRALRASDLARDSLDEDWSTVSTSSQTFLRLSPEEARQLVDELSEVVRAWHTRSKANRADPDPSRRAVRTIVHVFPEDSP